MVWREPPTAPSRSRHRAITIRRRKLSPSALSAPAEIEFLEPRATMRPRASAPPSAIATIHWSKPAAPATTLAEAGEPIARAAPAASSQQPRPDDSRPPAREPAPAWPAPPGARFRRRACARIRATRAPRASAISAKTARAINSLKRRSKFARFHPTPPPSRFAPRPRRR